MKTNSFKFLLLIPVLFFGVALAYGQNKSALPFTKTEWEQAKMPQNKNVEISRPPSNSSSNRVQDIDLNGWDNQFALNGILGQDVYAAKAANGAIYIGGDFEAVGTVPANNIAMWDGEKWSSMGDGLNGPVHTIYVNEMNNEVYAGGMFTHSGDIEMNFLAKWDGTSWHHVGKSPQDIKGIDVGGYVNVLEGVSGFLGNTTLYVGGSFNTTDDVKGTAYLSMWDGSEWHSVGGGSDRLVTALYNYGGNLYAGGFGSFGEVPFMAYWDGVTWQAMGENKGPNDAASTFYADGDNLYVGGFFTLVDEKPYQYLAQYDMANNQWHKLGYEPGKAEPEFDQPNGSVRTMCLVGGANALAIGGYFDRAGQTEISHVAYFSFEDRAIHPINSGIDNVVRALINDFDKLYAFGSFNGVNRGLGERTADVAYGASYTTINYENLSSSSWKAFESTTFNGIYNSADKMIEKDGVIFLVGSINYAGSEPISYIATWNGETWSKLADGLDAGWINDLVFIGDDLYVGGYLSVDADQDFICPLVARWDGTRWNPLGYGLAGTINSQVFALETDGENLFVGGLDLFYAINPDKSIIDIGNVAKWNGEAWSAMGDLDAGAGIVRSLEFHEDKLYAGGWIRNSNEEALDNLAYWDGQKWVKEGVFDGTVFTLKSAGDKLYAGGEFSNGIAVLENNTWDIVGEGFGTYSWVSDIEVVNNNVLAAGYIFSDGADKPLSHVVYFDGEDWSSLGGGSSWIVTDILPKANNFYIAGYGGVLGGSVPYSGFSVWNDKNYDIALGVKDTQLRGDETLIIYPNPSQGKAVVSIPKSINQEASYTITDMTGKLVYQGVIHPKESQELPIQINRKGLYILKIKAGKDSYWGKVIIE